jgi:hypothetical protein
VVKPSATKLTPGKPQAAKPFRENRRKHARVLVGLPVEVHISDLAAPLIVELMDIAPGGIRFRSLNDDVALGQVATFKFHVAEVGECAAEGKVLRIQPGGVFIVELERANRVYRDFVLSLAA